MTCNDSVGGPAQGFDLESGKSRGVGRTFVEELCPSTSAGAALFNLDD